MSTMETILCLYITLTIGELYILAPMKFDLSIFNPIRNYKEWYKLNWIGIITITTILNIVCLPYAICYWIYKLFTFSRK